MSATMRRLAVLSARPAARRIGLAVYGGCAMGLGFGLCLKDQELASRQLPSGFRACCDEGPRNVTSVQAALPNKLKAIVGENHVEFGKEQKGMRLGHGEAFAVVSPGSLQEALNVLQAVVDAGAVVVPQGKNTGLTGASVPRDPSSGLDRPTVVINMLRLNSVIPIDNGERMVCLAGAGIHTVLEKAATLNRQSHSVLGSIFLNPTTAAGIAFGSGGMQIRKGPVYTERVLYAVVDEQGKVRLENTLGLTIGDNNELFSKLENGTLSQQDVDSTCKLAASQKSYGDQVCQCHGEDAEMVSRCNADIRGPWACRSEGKVLILASVHDTFPLPKSSTQYWISVKDLKTAQRLKEQVVLGGGAKDLPTSCEYLERDSVTACDEAGRVMCWAISAFGIGKTLERLWNTKLAVASLPLPFMDILPDKIMYWVNDIFPDPLPHSVREQTQKFDHHVLVAIGDYGSGERKRFLERLDAFRQTNSVELYQCNDEESKAVDTYRAACAGAFRTWCVGKGLEGISVDYALPKGEHSVPALPEGSTVLRMRYSHFGCNVVHEDVAFASGISPEEKKMELKHIVERMHGKLPAEHGHGTEYHAPEETLQRWKAMDPLNVFNPGIGGLSMKRAYM